MATKKTEETKQASTAKSGTEDVQKVQIVPPTPEGGEIAEPGSEPSVPAKTSLNSAVTTDLANDPDAEQQSKDAQAAADEKAENDNSFEGRAARHGIGLVKVDGIDLRYIGVAPARLGGEAKTPAGLPITPENSTFTPLANVPFNPSIRCQTESGEYYYPADGVSSWDAVEFEGNPLVPRD